MSRHRAVDSPPTREWVVGELGRRHRLSAFHDPAATAASDAELRWMFPSTGDVEDDGHRAKVYRNIGVSAASVVLRKVFAEFESYVLRLTDQRIVEHRPLRSDEGLHADVFLDSHEAASETPRSADVYGVRIVFTDKIGAMVFTSFATFTGLVDADSTDRDVLAGADPDWTTGRHTSSINETSRSVS